MNKQNFATLSLAAAINIVLVWIISNLHVSDPILIAVSSTVSLLVTCTTLAILKSGFQFFAQVESITHELLLIIGSIAYMLGGVPVAILAILFSSSTAIVLSGVYFSVAIGLATVFWARDAENKELFKSIKQT